MSYDNPTPDEIRDIIARADKIAPPIPAHFDNLQRVLVRRLAMGALSTIMAAEQLIADKGGARQPPHQVDVAAQALLWSTIYDLAGAMTGLPVPPPEGAREGSPNGPPSAPAAGSPPPTSG